MKKILAIALVLVMAVSCCSVIFAAAEETDAAPFWITHYDTYSEEGAGMILTADCDFSDWDGAWCDHYAFKPIDGVKNGYELVDLVYGTIADGDTTFNGQGHTLDLPEGGFVYVTSIGNNWKTDEGYEDGIDYVNDNCNAQISRCRTWEVGDQFIITGLDLEGKVVPTTTPDTNWYDDSYVCTATIAPYDPNAQTEDSTEAEGSTETDPETSDETSDDETSTEPDDSYRLGLEEKAGEETADPDFTVDLDSTAENGVLTVVLTLKDFKEGVEMQTFNALLYYDTERLTLTNGKNDDESLNCVTKKAYGEADKWENLTTAKDGGLIDIQLIVADKPEQVLDKDHTFELTFTFEVKEGFDEVGVYVVHESIEGSNADTGASYYGKGGVSVAPVKAAPVEPSTPSDDDSTDNSTSTKPGDAGILVFAVLGILAVAGAVTVVKVRH